jgi:hypothetical protein
MAQLGMDGYDSNGGPLPLGFDFLPQVLAYDGSDRLQTITVEHGADTYTQTFTYTGGLLTGVSAWVKS